MTSLTRLYRPVSSALREELPGRPDMQLREMSVPGLPDGICFAQKNLDASRKRTSPQVVAVLGAKMDRTNENSPSAEIGNT